MLPLLGKSFCWGRDLLQKGIRWIVGSGDNIRVFKDPWLLRSNFFRPITIPSNEVAEVRVADLLSMTGWDQEPISRVLWEVDHAVVRSIPLRARRRMDRLVWHYQSRGVYTVKSGYQLEMQERVQASRSERSGEVSWWNPSCGRNPKQGENSCFAGLSQRYSGACLSSSSWDTY